MKPDRLSKTIAFISALLTALICAGLLAYAESGAPGKNGCDHVYADGPVWEWSSDHAVCSAVFTCADCGETLSLKAAVEKEWMGEGPDKNGGGRYYYTASVTFGGRTFRDHSPVVVTEGYSSPDPCPWDGVDHGDSFLGKLLRFCHIVLYYIVHLFEINDYGR